MIYDYCIIGGGILGLATARDLLLRQPDAKLLLLEKESAVAQHQTGHNSGVIHAGVYYQPGSLKARLCKAGAAATKRYCSEHGIAFETRGKLIVATDAAELARLEKLASNAEANGLAFERLDGDALREREPNIVGLGALHIPASGIVDYRQICVAMRDELLAQGANIRMETEVLATHEASDVVAIETAIERFQARQLIACAGLQSDRLARQSGLKLAHQIVPFRGEYYDIAPAKRDLVRHLIYPVPDPDLPFLGIHLTPMIDGSLTVGPNAVIGWAREGYAKGSVNLRDVLAFASFPGFWKVARAQWRSGLQEMGNSLCKARYLDACRKYCPSLELADLIERPAGIRAQAVTRDGALAQDFLFHQTPRALHIINAPSPAATSAMPIASMIAALAAESVTA